MSEGGGGGEGCIMAPPVVAAGAECGAGEYGGELRLWPGVWMESPAAAAADCAEYEASEAEGSIGAACGLRPLAMAKAFDGGGLAGGGGGGGGVVCAMPP